ncbi:hypothetical protein GQ457_08G027820 [Hibiscus cannabinus]
MWEDIPGSRDATAYWSAEQTKCRKDKAAKIFCCSHGTPAGIVPHVKGIFPYSVRAQNPRTTPTKGTLKELKRRELGRKEGEEKVKRGDVTPSTQSSHRTDPRWSHGEYRSQTRRSNSGKQP